MRRGPVDEAQNWVLAEVVHLLLDLSDVSFAELHQWINLADSQQGARIKEEMRYRIPIRSFLFVDFLIERESFGQLGRMLKKSIKQKEREQFVN